MCIGLFPCMIYSGIFTFCTTASTYIPFCNCNILLCSNTCYLYLKHVVRVNGNKVYSSAKRNILVFSVLYSIWIITSVTNEEKADKIKTRLMVQMYRNKCHVAQEVWLNLCHETEASISVFTKHKYNCKHYSYYNLYYIFISYPSIFDIYIHVSLSSLPAIK